MSDDSTATTNQVVPPAKDPLAVLEELLAKQKQAPPGAAAPAEPDLTLEAKEAELAQKQAEQERLQAEAAARDAQLLAQQEQKMQELSATPQYQARVDQNAAVEQEKQQHSDDQQGFGISQLTTTRVPTAQEVEQ
jgi:hypothetical protein